MKTCAIVHVGARAKRRDLLCSSLLTVGLAIGLVACTTAKPSSPSASSQPPAPLANLELNNGKKWVMPGPMMAHMRTVEKAVGEFSAAPQADHALLASEIQQNLGRLVTGCTMEGKAHDELHKWLMPFLGLSADYSKASDPRIQQQKLREMQQALLVFNEYFE